MPLVLMTTQANGMRSLAMPMPSEFNNLSNHELADALKEAKRRARAGEFVTQLYIDSLRAAVVSRAIDLLDLP